MLIRYLFSDQVNPEVPPDEADDQADLSDDDAADGDAADMKGRSRQMQVQCSPVD